MTHTLQIVDKISATPTVRLDLNSSPWRFLVEGHDFSPPPLRRAIAQTMMRSGATVGASAYDLRVLRFQLELDAADADSAATQVQNLARELNRADTLERSGASTYLKWQPGTTAPVFFRVFPSDMGTVRELAPRDQTRFFELQILAEPFAYGLQEDAGTFTVANDPAAVSNPMYFDLTGLKGDVDTPLILEIDGSGLADSLLPVSVLATRRRGTPGNMPIVLQAESMALTSDTTLQATTRRSPEPAATTSGATSPQPPRCPSARPRTSFPARTPLICAGNIGCSCATGRTRRRTATSRCC